MTRFPHWLRGNKGGELPHSVVFVDTETDPVTYPDGVTGHRLRFGWAAYERTLPAGTWSAPEWFRFADRESFWTWLEARTRPKTRTFVFAHNWSFDGPVLGIFEVPQRRGWTLTRAIIEAPPVILAYRRETTTIELLDTLNWWRMSLRAIGDSVGQPKLVMPKGGDSREKWDTYCRADVEVLRVALHAWWSFLRTHDLGGFARTLAGQALRAYRHRFMDSPILIDDDSRALALARESYHGGRTECFRLGKVEGPVHAFDVNSMYPAVMADGMFPAALVRFLRIVSVDDLAKWLLRYSVVARVLIETRRNRFAVVRSDKLIFPTGRFWTALTSPEIEDALAHGEIRAADEVALYDRAPLFSRFVAELYALRRDAAEREDGVQSFLLKILMNSLYGKFAQRGSVWEGRGEAPDARVRSWLEYDVVEGTTRELRQFGGLLQERMRDEESRESHPAIASTVTALARTRLWYLIQTVGAKEAIYCDTDSLYCTAIGAARLGGLVDPGRLGALKVEGVHAWMILHGPKDYEVPGHVTVKGVRPTATWTSTSTVEQDQWTGLRGLLQRGSLDEPLTLRVTKRLAREYTKGLPLPDGRVLPLALADDSASPRGQGDATGHV